MATIKKLYFPSGVDVTAPTDLTSESSTVHVAEYANDAAFVSANGTATGGDLYINTTLKALRLYTGSSWRTVIMSTDDADPTKTFLVDLDGSTTSTSATLDFNQTASRVYTFPDYAGIVALNTGTETSPTLFSGATGTTTIGHSSGTVSIAGNFEVQGTQTILNTQTVEVEDANIIVNNGGNDATSEGAGLTVERTGTHGSLIYKAASATKFALGNLGSEVDAADISTAQTFTNKTMSGDSNTFTNIDLTSATSGVLPTTKGGTGVNGSASYPSSGTVATVPSSGVVKSNGSVLSASNVSLTTEVTGTLPIANGGTGQTTANAALNALLPTQAGNSGKVLQTDGSNTSWQAAGGGSGSGELNVVQNPNNADAGWVASGAGITVATTSTSSDLPLGGISTTAIKITPVSGTDYVRYRWTMPAAMKQRKFKFEWHQRPLSGYASGDIKVEIYKNSASDYTGSYTEFALSTDVSGTSSVPNQSGKFTTYFDADDADYYELRYVRVAGTTALNIANVIVGVGIQPQGAVVSGWSSYTPSSTISTNVTWTGLYRRVGDLMEIQTQALFSGANTQNTDVRFSIPSGFTIDSTNIISTSQDIAHIGNGVFHRSSTVHYDMQCAYYDNNEVAVWASNEADPAKMQRLNLNSATPFTPDSATRFTFSVKIPIAEWAGSGTLNTAQNDVEYASNSATGNVDDSTSFVYGVDGSSIPTVNLTTIRQRRVRFQSPIQPTDRLILEFKVGTTNAKWVPLDALDTSSGIQPLHIQNTTHYGAGIQAYQINATDIDVYFGRYAYNSGATYAAAGQEWTGIGTVRWRVRKEAAGTAVGFGLVSGAASGLVPAMTPQTSLTVTGTNWTTIRAVGQAYSDTNGQWRFRFNIRGSLSISANDITLTVSGVTAKNGGANSEQAISAGQMDSGGIATNYAWWNTNSTSLRVRYSANVVTMTVSGDIELESKPTWA